MKGPSAFNPFPIRIWGGNIFWCHYFGVESAVEETAVVFFPFRRLVCVDKIPSQQESFDVRDAAEWTLLQLLGSKVSFQKGASVINFAFAMSRT